MLTAPSASPCAWSMRDGIPKPSAATPSSGRSRTIAASSSSSAACDVVTVGRSTVSCTRSVGVDDSRQHLRAAEVDTDHTSPGHGAGNLPRRMAREEKPYRVYRGGRAKGKVPHRPARACAEPGRQGRRGGLPRPGHRVAEARTLGTPHRSCASVGSCSC